MSTDMLTTDELTQRLESLERRIAELEENAPEDKLSMVVFSGDLDRVLAAFVIATGAAAMGKEVSMFFTFWGLSAIKKKSTLDDKSVAQKMMAMMTPSSTASMGVSKMNFFGIGARMLRAMMKQKGVASVEELIQLAKELGVRIVACEMSRDVMGVHDDELMDGFELGGVATFLGDALRSRSTLFI